MTAPQAVIFDIGNVLLEWNPERFYDWQIGRAQREALFAEVDLHAMNEAIDAGAPFRDTIYDLADRTPDWADEIRMWHDNWLDMASPRIDGSVTLLRALRSRGVAVFALTNFGIGSFDYAKTRYDFLSEFDRAYVSGHLGVTKPDPRIYERVEADCGLPPGALLFTDDREANIAVALQRGWRCHLFERWQGWARRLVTEGLLNEKEAGL
ncbi:2-haloacid dehalogenase [Gemmobacter caeni]|uniref:2-haloacid dehalogenase n=1 Tax=Gemmobacter caeni TaxID=589035 RepID=A0A2T6B229_9RHOB|nr:HAD family phosphatase [Gemmobacter caeni]PTX50092.1 2-haloacid dehalogenase [Gemmobacter caeni]TWJ01987.1 2-haloacid dehalogenase [Gemmobacter caeni]